MPRFTMSPSRSRSVDVEAVDNAVAAVFARSEQNLWISYVDLVKDEFANSLFGGLSEVEAVEVRISTILAPSLQ
jgi:hypothetical protein